MYLKNNIPSNYREYVHFGLTSQDINNPSMVMLHREFTTGPLKTDIENMKTILNGFVNDYSKRENDNIYTWATATPTSFGKQMAVFSYKITEIIDDLYEKYSYKTKLGGANGDFTALKLAYPNIHWDNIITNFVNNSLK